MTRQTKSQEENWNYVCVVIPNSETANDNEKTKTNTKHMKSDT